MDNKLIPQFMWENEDKFTVCATAGGRILYVTGELIYFIGQNPTGRNLNDLIPDDRAADIIAGARQNIVLNFECTIDKCLFSCTSRQVNQEIKITMIPINDPQEVFIDKNAATLISCEMSDSLQLMRLYLDDLIKSQESEKEKRATAVINQQIYRMTRLARNVYDTAMWVNGYLRPGFTKEDIAAICRKLVEKLKPLLADMDITLLSDISPNPVIAMVDKDKIERIILNLIANSIKALTDNRVIRLDLAVHSNNFSITVTDYGIGADMEVFFGKTADLESEDLQAWRGAGFGVALVRAYTKSHGGTFVVTGTPGSQTVVRISLPYNLDRESSTLHTLVPTYSSGLSTIYTELSTVLGKEHYCVNSRKKQ